MYINIKSKYKKIFWLLVGFCLACIFTNKVYALELQNGFNVDSQFLSSIWSTYFEGKSVNNINNTSTSGANYNRLYDDTFTKVFFLYTNNDKNITIYFARFDSEIIVQKNSNTLYNYGFYIPVNTLSTDYAFYPGIVYNTQTNSFVRYALYNNYVFNYIKPTDVFPNYMYNGDTNSRIGMNFDIAYNNSLYKEHNIEYPSSTPIYLNGYKKITLSTDDKYYMLSGLSSGSVFIPFDDFNSSGGRLSYYDNDLSSQSYTSYIQDYVTTEDGLYVRQDFDLSSYPGSDFVMFSKYIYLEGEDNITYDIWVPNDIYDSQVTITPNSSGGNSFDFEYKDSNGDIQSEQVNSVDLGQDSPLLGNVFSDFSSNTFGLTSIITAPLNLIRSMSSNSCSSLQLPLPFIGGTLTLPCMYSFYSNTFGSLFDLYQTITFGIIAYYVSVRIFNLVKDFKNPDHDEIEVIDL